MGRWKRKKNRIIHQQLMDNSEARDIKMGGGAASSPRSSCVTSWRCPHAANTLATAEYWLEPLSQCKHHIWEL